MNTFAFIFTGLCGLLIIKNLQNIIQFIKLKQWSANLPGPTFWQLLAAVKKGEILAWFIELHKKHGSTFRVWLGKDLIVFITHPEDIRQLLSNNNLLYKSKSYKIITPWLGNGIFTNGGESWHNRRKMLTPAFHFRILSEFKEPIEENCKILVAKLREKANGEPFDIHPYITLFALDAICETAMGIKKNAQMQSSSEYVQSVETMCHVLIKRCFSLWQRNNIVFKFSDLGRQSQKALKILHGETNRVIKLRRKMLNDANIRNTPKQEDNIGTKRRFAFLDMLLISQMEGVPLTDTEIREEVDTFMFGGHDTTSSALGFIIYLLSQHDEVQQRAYEEVVALEGCEKEPMPYLEAIIKESLRLYPVAPFFSRFLTEDLPIRNVTIPKGASVNCLIHVLHRDEKYFPNPLNFDPERFLTKENSIHPFSYVPFSAGPRNCIGQKFAMLELKCSLSHLLRNFYILPVDGFKPHILAEIVIKSGNGIQIRLKPRL